MASRIAAVGRVTVSERRSIGIAGETRRGAGGQVAHAASAIWRRSLRLPPAVTATGGVERLPEAPRQPA